MMWLWMWLWLWLPEDVGQSLFGRCRIAFHCLLITLSHFAFVLLYCILSRAIYFWGDGDGDSEERRLSALALSGDELAAMATPRPISVMLRISSREIAADAEAAAERAAEADPWRPPSPLNRAVQDRLFSGIFRSLS